MGRTALFMIIVFNVTFMMMGFRLSTVTSSAYEKYVGYGEIEQAGLAMESASNIAISDAFLTNYSNVSVPLCIANEFGNGKFSITKTPQSTPLGIPDGYILTVSGSYHLTGCYTLLGLPDSIRLNTSIRVRGNSFSQYVFYSESEKIGASAIYWTSGDICRGRLHTQDNLSVNGNAVFKGKVTTKGSVKISSGAHPVFEQGYSKADVTLPTALTELSTLGAAGGALYNNVKTYVEFKNDGRVIVRTGSNGWTENRTGNNPSTSPVMPYCKIYPNINTLTTSGVLLVQGSELHVKGILDGKITLGAIGSGSSVWLDSSIVYREAPPSTQYPANVSDDMLGIVAENDIMITDNTNNNNLANGFTLHASMFSQKGGFGAQNYDSRGTCGTIKLIGGMQQKNRRAVGQSNTPRDGFLKDYDFDLNLTTGQPVGYPRTPFVVQNWVDLSTIPNDFFTK